MNKYNYRVENNFHIKIPLNISMELIHKNKLNSIILVIRFQYALFYLPDCYLR